MKLRKHRRQTLEPSQQKHSTYEDHTRSDQQHQSVFNSVNIQTDKDKIQLFNQGTY